MTHKTCGGRIVIVRTGRGSTHYRCPTCGRVDPEDVECQPGRYPATVGISCLRNSLQV